MINYNFKIELTGGRTICSDAVFTSGDIGGYRLSFTFFNNGKKVFNDSYTLCIKAMRADGTLVTDVGDLGENGEIFYNVKNSMISVPGEIKFEVALSDASGMYVTCKEILATVRKGYGEGGVDAKDTVPFMSKILAYAQSASNSASLAMQSAKDAEINAFVKAKETAENVLGEKVIKSYKYYEKAGITPSLSEWFEFEIDEEKGEAKIVDFSNLWLELSSEEKHEIVIPYEYEGVKVTKIGNYSFNNLEGDKGIKSLILPSTITYIGELAFSHQHIKEIFIPKSVELVRTDAFYDCQDLRLVYIQNDDLMIENGAFFKGVSNPGDVIFVCNSGSSVLEYAKNSGFDYALAEMVASSYVETVDFEDGKIIVTKGDGKKTEIAFSGSDYVDEAIGDVEKALENIISKYGLGGDGK